MSEKQSSLQHGTEPTDEASEGATSETDEVSEGATSEVADRGTPSECVVAAVADASNTDPTELDPLAEAIDPDALDALFGERHDGTARDAGTVRFSFSGYEVVADSDGCISVLETGR